jgi:thiopeptide-type bacteriocin biosynthesis protein
MDAPRPLRHIGFAIVRTPALPMAQWRAHVERGAGGDTWQGRADSGQALFRLPLVTEAIYLASPSLHARLSHWDWRVRDGDDRKLLAAFERYLNRMCSRATPFGLFATASFAPVVPGQGWTLDAAPAAAPPERAARVDGEALYALVEKAQSGQPGPGMRYAVNASLYRVGMSYRYIEWSCPDGTERVYQIGEIDSHPVIDALVERMGERILDCQSVAALVADIGSQEDIDLTALVEDLVAAKVLLPAIVVDPLHANPAGALAAALARVPAHAAAGAQLAELNGRLRALPATQAIEHYPQADRDIRALAGIEPGHLPIQVDTFRRHPLMAVDAADVEAAIAAFDWLMDRFSFRHGPLDSFCDAFSKRYGSGMVPLMEALDPEAGIGFRQSGMSNKLLAALGIRRPAAPSQYVVLGPFDKLLMTLIQRNPALLAAREVEITRADAAALPFTRDGSEGNGMTTVFSFPLLRGADGKVARTAVLSALDTEGTLNWVGRFCHGDPRMGEAARAHALHIEELSGPDVVHAGIAYLPPRVRAVNVVTRPPLWTWRINLAEAAAEPGEHDLPVSDLMLSVAGREVQLWSRRLRKRVIPHKDTAHSVEDERNMTAYRFLCTMASHGMRAPQLDWGHVFAGLEYQPRLRFESLVLAPARWRIGKAALAQLDGTRAALRGLLAQRGVPRHVELAQGDNRLLLDLDDEIDLEQLLRVASKASDLLLFEVLDDQDASAGANATPAWRHQVAVPLYRPSHPPRAIAERRFERDLVKVPMAEALYVKLYGGEETIDKRVLPHVAAWIAGQRRRGAIDNWFFIRYPERGWHLRLRVFPVPGRDQEVHGALVKLAEELQEHSWISHFEFAPYEREMIRYGGAPHIGANESLFGIDSDLAGMIAGGELFGNVEAPARWSSALLAIDALLRDFGLSLGQKLALATRMAAGFKAEFELAGKPLAALGDWYRRHAREMIAALKRDERAPAWSAPLWRALDSVSARRSELAAPLRAADPQLSMLESQVHMLCNRLFIAQNREFEVLVYDFLARAYRALAAMQSGGRHGTS